MEGKGLESGVQNKVYHKPEGIKETRVYLPSRETPVAGGYGSRTVGKEVA